MMRSVTLLLAMLCFTISSMAQDKKRVAFIDKLMQKMTIEEKIGQLNLPDYGQFNTGISGKNDVENLVRNGQCGALFGIRGQEKIRKIQELAVEHSRLGIPLFFGLDVIHGFETVFPIPLAMASSWDMDAIRDAAHIAATECSAEGLNWTFSPMVDICHDARWGRVAEGSGEDPFLGSAIAKAMIEGYQGNMTKSSNIAACVKHFALYGAAEAGRDYNTVDMSPQRMFNEYLAPYKAAFDAGVFSAMSSFNTINYIPATGNRWLLTDLLRHQWGWEGVVVTDYNAPYEMVSHGMGSQEDVSALALKAGVDLDMADGAYLTHLKKLLDEGRLTERSINQACRRILEMKYDMGLFADPYKYLKVKHPEKTMCTPQNREAARKLAAETFVLLKNEGNVLPLKKEGKIAVVGPLANTSVNMFGNWSISVDREKYPAVTVLDGIRNAVGSDAEVFYAKGSNVYYDAAIEKNGTFRGGDLVRDERTPEEMLNEALAVACQCDVIIAAVGETAEMTGESSSRSQLSTPDAQADLLKALKELGKPIVVLYFTGRPVVLNWEQKNIPAILNVWFGGSEAGNAIADVVFGEVCPSGKLTVSFPQNEGQLPYSYASLNTGRSCNGKWFGKYTSSYLDVSNDMLYPFGYGLSYTTFDYTPVSLDKSEMRQGEVLKASVVVTNTGSRAADEVVQLYIRDVVGSISRPVKELKGFRRIHLEPGESSHVSFDIDEDMLKFYNADLQYVVEPGEFHVMIGCDSEHVTTSSFEYKN